MPGTRPLDSSNHSNTHAGPDFVPPTLTIKLALHTADEKIEPLLVSDQFAPSCME
jgi:hypothetical protein